MTKIIAYSALHYGREYLAYAAKSVMDFIDEWHVFYAAKPSHGFQSSEGLTCPETRDELYAIAKLAAGSKLIWHDGEWAHEGLHREQVYADVPDADVILVLDSDEIWRPETLDMVEDEMNYKGGHIKIPMYHMWRSFRRGIDYDMAAPPRVLFPKGNQGLYLSTGLDNSIAHFGYAQTPEIVRYKSTIHGHSNEWRKEWYKERFLVNAQADVHPCGGQWHTVNEIDAWAYLPTWMQEHPYANLAVIE